MDVHQKMQLMHMLAARFGWLMRAYSKRYEVPEGGHNFDFDEMWLGDIMDVRFVSGDFAEGVFSSYASLLDESDYSSYGLAVKALSGYDTFETYLGYDYSTGSVVFEVDSPTVVDVSYEFPTHLLEFLKEEDIRRVFREHEETFLHQTKTTYADWRIEEF